MSLQLNKQELSSYLQDIFPEVIDDFVIEKLDIDGVTMRLRVGPKHLRPGGTVSGPSMFALGDVAIYAMVLSRLGREALAVTTNASIDFLRKPAAGQDLIARGTLLKLGRSLAVGEVVMYSADLDTPVARASMTYSIPPKSAV